MATRKVFDDGSSVEWIDKETIKYTEGDYSLLIWVDFEPGFFSYGRTIKSASIETWDTKPRGESKLIDENKKQDIIDKIQRYYKSFGKRCRII